MVKKIVPLGVIAMLFPIVVLAEDDTTALQEDCSALYNTEQYRHVISGIEEDYNDPRYFLLRRCEMRERAREMEQRVQQRKALRIDHRNEQAKQRGIILRETTERFSSRTIQRLTKTLKLKSNPLSTPSREQAHRDLACSAYGIGVR